MKLIRVDLTQELGEGQYIEIRDAKQLPWGEQKKLVAAMKDQNDVNSRIDFAETLVISLIRNGNIFDENGNPISLPITKDTIDLVPAEVFEVVSAEFTKARTKGADVPKK